MSAVKKSDTWKAATLQDLVFLQRGFDITKEQQKPGDYPVISSSGKTSLHNEYRVEGPGVIIGRKGSLGTVHFSAENYWPHDTTLWSKDFKGNDPRYVFYFLQTLDLAKYNVGGANPTLNRNHIHGLDIKIPSIPIQRKIAAILSAYDDLIENNLKRIALLEESARQLYREWFIRLGFPGHEHTRIVDGLPEGWDRAKVGDVLLKVKRKKKIQKDVYLDEGAIPCVDQSVTFIGGYTDDEEAKHDEPLPIIVFGDHTRILKFIDFPFACGADGTQLLHPNRENISPEFFYLALDAIDLSNYFYARHFKFLKEQKLVLPEENLIRDFTNYAKSGFKQIKNLRSQNQKLKQARNLLLPRLMSGEIPI